MDRTDFIKTSLFGIFAMATLPYLRKLTDLFPEENTKMPVLFVGHGSPMNAIEDNEFSKGWEAMGKSLSKPNAIICISAHWETRGTYVTAMENPKTIHDFGGFPQALFDIQYPAPGSPATAKLTKETIKKAIVGLDEAWGLDHGCWSVAKRMYPNADIPIIQLSLDYTKDTQSHYDLAKQLSVLRTKGVLILGSGNIVHNLGLINWQDFYAKMEWAEEANEKFKTLILKNDIKSLIEYNKLGKSASLAIPTPEHYLPMLYTLSMKEEQESLSFFNDKTMGPISMTSFRVG
jgi:4,5-DOPA dioxygenase extradiol